MRSEEGQNGGSCPRSRHNAKSRNVIVRGRLCLEFCLSDFN